MVAQLCSRLGSQLLSKREDAEGPHMEVIVFMLCVTAQDYESRLEALQKQVESYLPGAPEPPGAEGSVNSCIF